MMKVVIKRFLDVWKADYNFKTYATSTFYKTIFNIKPIIIIQNNTMGIA